jgi:hypothetical protein
MAKPEISEFSFGFCFTQEFIRLNGIRMAPVFPTQPQEAELGYDVSLAPVPFKPIFLQYKRSDVLTTANAKNFAEFQNRKYFRFEIMSRKLSKQHQLLIDLEQINPEVYYAAPKFHKYKELNGHYQGNAVVSHSLMIHPSEIGVITDDESHQLSFAENGPKRVLNSTQGRVFDSTTIFNIDRVRTQHRSEFTTVEQYNSYFSRLFDDKDGKIPRAEESQSALRKFFFYCKVRMGMDAVIVP